MPDPVLYSFRRCPYAIRARLALTVSGTSYEHREIRLRDKPDAMLTASPKGTVPVLILADGQVIDQSLDIIYWALARNDPHGWLDGDDPALIATNDGPFKHHLDRTKYPDRHASDPAEHRAACLALLAPLETRLATQSWLTGDRCTLTDAAIMPFVRQFAAIDRPWFDAQPLPALQSWLAVQLTSPLFAQVMAIHPVWQPQPHMR